MSENVHGTEFWEKTLRRWQCNIKVDREGNAYEGVDWIHLAQVWIP